MLCVAYVQFRTSITKYTFCERWNFSFRNITKSASILCISRFRRKEIPKPKPTSWPCALWMCVCYLTQIYNRKGEMPIPFLLNRQCAPFLDGNHCDRRTPSVVHRVWQTQKQSFFSIRNHHKMPLPIPGLSVERE